MLPMVVAPALRRKLSEALSDPSGPRFDKKLRRKIARQGLASIKLPPNHHREFHRWCAQQHVRRTAIQAALLGLVLRHWELPTDSRREIEIARLSFMRGDIGAIKALVFTDAEQNESFVLATISFFDEPDSLLERPPPEPVYLRPTIKANAPNLA